MSVLLRITGDIFVVAYSVEVVVVFLVGALVTLRWEWQLFRGRRSLVADWRRLRKAVVPR